MDSKIKVEFVIPDSVYVAFEARCISIADRVFNDKLKAVQRERVKLTRKEAAKRLRLSLPTLDKHLNGGTIKYQKVGKRILIPESELENFLNRDK